MKLYNVISGLVFITLRPDGAGSKAWILATHLLKLGFVPVSCAVFGFRFYCQQWLRFFRIFVPNSFYGFSGFAEEVTPCSRAETVIPRDHLRLEECMASLVSLVVVICVVTAAK